MFEIQPATGAKASLSRRSTPPQHVGEEVFSKLALLFGGLSAYQAAGPQHFGTAAENLWNAYGAQRALNNPLLAAALAVVGIAQLADGQWLGSATSLCYYASLRATSPGRGALHRWINRRGCSRPVTSSSNS